MNKFNKGLCIAVDLLAILMSGCTTGNELTPTSTVSFTPDTVDSTKLLDSIQQSAGGVQSYRIDTTSQLPINEQSSTTSFLTGLGTGLFDLAHKESYLDQTTIDFSLSESLSQRSETYWIGEWAYVIQAPKFSPNDTSIGIWHKYPVSDLQQPTSSFCSYLDIVSTLESSKAGYVGNETVNGIECYKMSLTGDHLAHLLSESKTVSDMNMTVWVSKSDYRLVSFSLTYKTTVESVAAVRINGIFSAYNRTAVSLPTDASTAIEVIRLPQPTPQTELQPIIRGINQANNGIASYRADVSTATITKGKDFKTSTNSTAIEFSESDRHRYSIDQIVDTTITGNIPILSNYLPPPTGRNRFYSVDGTLYMRFDGNSAPGQWQKQTGPPGGTALVSNLERITKVLQVANMALSQDSTNGIEYYSFSILDSYSNFLPYDPSMTSDVNFTVWVSKDSFQVVGYVLSYTLSDSTYLTQYSSVVTFSQFNQVTVVLPSEASGAPDMPLISFPTIQ